MSEALIGPIYGGVLGLGRHFRLLYGTQALDYLLKTPTPTPAELTTWLDTPANLDAYQRLIATNAGASALCSSSAVMTAIAGSTKALEVLRDSSTGSAALTNSKVAIDAVLAAGAAAMVTVLAVRAVRTAIYVNDVAFNALLASANGKSALNSIAVEHANTTTTHMYPPGVNAATRTVFVSQKSGVSTTYSYAGMSADTYFASGGNWIDRYVRLTGLTHRSTTTGASTIRYVVME